MCRFSKKEDEISFPMRVFAMGSFSDRGGEKVKPNNRGENNDKKIYKEICVHYLENDECLTTGVSPLLYFFPPPKPPKETGRP